jgi:hypothetical protein
MPVIATPYRMKAVRVAASAPGIVPKMKIDATIVSDHHHRPHRRLKAHCYALQDRSPGPYPQHA